MCTLPTYHIDNTEVSVCTLTTNNHIILIILSYLYVFYITYRQSYHIDNTELSVCTILTVNHIDNAVFCVYITYRPSFYIDNTELSVCTLTKGNHITLIILSFVSVHYLQTNMFLDHHKCIVLPVILV